MMDSPALIVGWPKGSPQAGAGIQADAPTEPQGCGPAALDTVQPALITHLPIGIKPFLLGETNMLLLLFIVLLVAWLFGWAVFHVAGGLIHLLLIFALISLVFHLVRGPARTRV
jgi:hypothetical protein